MCLHNIISNCDGFEDWGVLYEAKQIKTQYEERLRQARERGEVIEEPSESSSEVDSEENGNEDQNEHGGLTSGSLQPDNVASVVTLQDDSMPPPLEDAPKQEGDVSAVTTY